jgi:hypothetical protein
VNYANNHFYLQSNSPCRGAGEGGKDMGAKDYNPAVAPTSLGRVKALFE